MGRDWVSFRVWSWGRDWVSVRHQGRVRDFGRVRGRGRGRGQGSDWVTIIHYNVYSEVAHVTTKEMAQFNY